MSQGDNDRREAIGTAYVFFCHGARAAAWREPFDQITRQFALSDPARRVELAFLEWMQPDLPSTLNRLSDEGYEHIHVFPLFLAPGGHTQRDLPELLGAARRRWPHIRFTTSPTLTESEFVRSMIVQWANTGTSADSP